MRRERAEAGDWEAIEGWIRGDADAVRTVFERCYPQAVRLAVLSGLPRDAAEDCAQETLIRAFERRRQLRSVQAFSLWLHRIATREILRHLRMRGRQGYRSLDDEAELGEDWQRDRMVQPDEVALAAEVRAELWHRVELLPPRQRVAVVLRYYEDLTPHEVARVMGMHEGTARVTLHRALAQLRQRTGGWNNDETGEIGEIDERGRGGPARAAGSGPSPEPAASMPMNRMLPTIQGE
jgi:RNA polymerase sigma-70 factor (ECF subfamily)